jgi:transcriptional regulator with XRE-family HTH domain
MDTKLAEERGNLAGSPFALYAPAADLVTQALGCGREGVPPPPSTEGVAPLRRKSRLETSGEGFSARARRGLSLPDRDGSDLGDASSVANGELTPNEALFLNRRRLGLTQKAAAERLGLPLSTFAKIERGEKPWVPEEEISGPLTAFERCLLFRRRVGYTQSRVARELGCCRSWINLMERGLVPCDDLVWYWEQ